jgi:GNAT superfamily N-acetyltransferase
MAIIKFRYDVPLERTMAFEGVYQESQKLDLSQKKKFWDIPGSLFAWMLVDGELAGETYGVPAGCIEGLSNLTESEKKTAIHCYSNTILPSFQRRGLGAILKAHWLGLAAAKGFVQVYGFARPGPSQSLNAKFGAVFLGCFPNWCGTGEEYRMYRLPLK